MLKVYDFADWKPLNPIKELRLLSAKKSWKWQYDDKTSGGPYVELKDGSYYADLSTFQTSAQVLDFVAQVSKKVWGTPKTVGQLVRMLDLALNLQSNYCPMGIDRGNGDKPVQAAGGKYVIWPKSQRLSNA